MNNCYGEKILTAGTILSIKIAECLPEDDVEILAALFTVLGDQLALLLAARGICQSNDKSGENGNNGNNGNNANMIEFI